MRRETRERKLYIYIYMQVYKAFIIHNSSEGEIAGSILQFLAARQVSKNSQFI
jgi:hypothetical protein